MTDKWTCPIAGTTFGCEPRFKLVGEDNTFKFSSETDLNGVIEYVEENEDGGPYMIFMYNNYLYTKE